ncbi:D-Ala-D-Ala carboxypeptidase family metallohydrolase [Oceanibaculum indicum]|uniref:Peptidase M15A C-terminal domain-containing protein n=1 Tax=Oceanibaculum indicum P24 TaxID=1207063 RepID=K2J747_9PROT|nr:D-Ala-D-Ala carboxypeptidase family metallohydrolase [Oceanibaculum indicum]EKE70903.1 hypothetical protein P24_15209 [Oceanibaculum indicum P24]
MPNYIVPVFIDWSLYPSFTPAELACRDSGLLQFHPGFLASLQSLRDAFGRPMVPTSGCRSRAYNDRPRAQGGVGGHPRSLHVADDPVHADKGQLGCLAVDIRTPDAAWRGDLFACAWRMGWSVGWGRGFLHLDRRDFIGLAKTSFDY